MAERDFREIKAWQRDNQKQVCVGLDTDINLLNQLRSNNPGLEQELRPYSRSLEVNSDYVRAYNRLIIAATTDIAGAYKPNRAFYEELGANGYATLRDTVRNINHSAPNVMTILDTKIQDIGTTNRPYGVAYIDDMQFDAVTVHPYLGSEALKILTDRADKGFLVMGRTSNPGAGELQDLTVKLKSEQFEDLLNGPARQSGEERDQLQPEMELYKVVALRVANHWNVNENVGLVAGATYPQEAGFIRKMVGPNLFLLIPGVGEQGGKAGDIVPLALRDGEDGVINSSRGIIFAKRQAGESQFAAIRREALKLHNEIVTAQDKKAA